MKHYSFICFSVLISSILLISCEKNEDNSSEDTNGFTLDGKFYPTTWAHAGNWEYNGEYGTLLELLSTGMTSEGGAEHEGRGHGISFELITPDSELVAGRYLFDKITYDGDDKFYTCNAWIFINEEAGKEQQNYRMVAGEVNISINANKIDVEYSMTLNNNLQLRGEYSGELAGLDF